MFTRFYCEEHGVAYRQFDCEQAYPDEYSFVVIGRARSAEWRCDTCNQPIALGSSVCFLGSFPRDYPAEVTAAYAAYIDPRASDTRVVWRGNYRPA